MNTYKNCIDHCHSCYWCNWYPYVDSSN